MPSGPAAAAANSDSLAATLHAAGVVLSNASVSRPVSGGRCEQDGGQNIDRRAGAEVLLSTSKQCA